MENEEWRPVVGYEGSYEVSSLGMVRRVGSHVRALSRHHEGYLLVNLSVAGRSKTHRVHRLVADAFLGPSVARGVNHLNGVKSDNRASNLEWATDSQNARHKARVLRIGVRSVECRPAGSRLAWFRYPSIAEASECTGAGGPDICKVLAGRGRTAAGYEWRYAA